MFAVASFQKSSGQSFKT